MIGQYTTFLILNLTKFGQLNVKGEKIFFPLKSFFFLTCYKQVFLYKKNQRQNRDKKKTFFNSLEMKKKKLVKFKDGK